MTTVMEDDEYAERHVEAAARLLPDDGFIPDAPQACTLLSIAHSLLALALEAV